MLLSVIPFVKLVGLMQAVWTSSLRQSLMLPAAVYIVTVGVYGLHSAKP